MRSRCESLRHRCGRKGAGGILRPARQEYAEGRGGATRSIPSASFNWCRFGMLLQQRLEARVVADRVPDGMDPQQCQTTIMRIDVLRTPRPDLPTGLV